jgi:hypothetical protein
MTLPNTPDSIAEALEVEQRESIRRVHEREEREREAIPLRDPAPHASGRVPSSFKDP